MNDYTGPMETGAEESARMSKSRDPWADVRGLVETLDLSEATGANLAPIDYQIMMLLNDADAMLDSLEHCGYDPDDCIDCGGPPHNEWCRFWKLRHILIYWPEHLK